MSVTLAVIKSPAGVSMAAPHRTFTEQGGTIGRGDANDWVLSDPDRFLSSKHCGLSFEGGQYYLTDMSTNGTFINGAPEPVGKGGRIPLNNGDTIEIGDYQFRAELGDVGATPGASDPFAAPPPFDNTPPLDPPSFDQPPLEDPFFSPGSAQNPPAGDPFANGSFDDVPLTPGGDSVDPLAYLDKAGISGGDSVSDSADPFNSGGSNSGHLPGADPFSPQAPPAADPFARSTVGDGADAMNQSMDWPNAKSESVIPDDWDDDDLMGGGAPSLEEPFSPQPPPRPNVQVQQPPQPPSVGSNNPLDIANAHRSMPLTDPPRAVTPPPQPRVEGDLMSERAPERVDPFVAQPPAGAQPPGHQQAPMQHQGANPVQQTGVQQNTGQHTSVPRTQAAQQIGDALLSGMGLAGENLSADRVNEIHAEVGELMPVIVAGMMQVLRSRASIKNEFRMNVTTIQPVENNPLKFSADPHEAIANMFARKSSAYKGAKDAFQEGFDGVGEHQVAIIAGIRAAFKSMMDRFNPETLEQQFEKHSKGVALPGMQKTKYWNSYIDYYKGFIDNMENSFQYLFGDEFVQAYEEQLRRLAVERKRRR